MGHRVRGSLWVVAVALAGGVWAAPLEGQSARQRAWTPPKTGWGHPDLQGVWNNATSTPLERPNELGGKAELSDEEAASIEEEAVRRRDAPPPAGDPGTYNAFWSDTGRGGVNKRTSWIRPMDGFLR
jgi:hypothetical protein